MAYQKRPWHQKTDPPPTGTSIKADQVGITHIGLWVDNLDAIYAALKSQGGPFVVPPHVLLQTPTGGVRSAFALDPDGILVHSINLLGTRRSDGRSMVAH